MTWRGGSATAWVPGKGLRIPYAGDMVGNAIVVYKAITGDVAWMIVRSTFVEQAKQGLRMYGTPVTAVVRWKCSWLARGRNVSEDE